jgi:hypothetical protein
MGGRAKPVVLLVVHMVEIIVQTERLLAHWRLRRLVRGGGGPGRLEQNPHTSSLRSPPARGPYTAPKTIFPFLT